MNHYKPNSLTRFLILARYGCEEGDPIARKILRVHMRYSEHGIEIIMLYFQNLLEGEGKLIVKLDIKTRSH